jgi:hypothetical protein
MDEIEALLDESIIGHAIRAQITDDLSSLFDLRAIDFEKISAAELTEDSSLEESGFELLVPAQKGRALRRADRNRLPVCQANCETTVGLRVRIRFPPPLAHP